MGHFIDVRYIDKMNFNLTNVVSKNGRSIRLLVSKRIITIMKP